MDVVGVNGHDRTIPVILGKYCIRLPEDGSFVIRDMLSTFKHLIILTISTKYIFVHLLDDNVFVTDARCKLEDSSHFIEEN